jgi:hypothetical protein
MKSLLSEKVRGANPKGCYSNQGGLEGCEGEVNNR